MIMTAIRPICKISTRSRSRKERETQEKGHRKSREKGLASDSNRFVNSTEMAGGSGCFQVVG